jgi:1-acyl-sn-glycerol-3-phosphate acyltransferase
MGGWLTKVNPLWSVKVTGAEIVTNPRNPYVVVSNHQSMADIPCISRLPWDMKWVSKAVMLKVPVAGRLLRLAGDIPVNRSDKTSRGQVYPKAMWVLENKCSVMFFAEGTRSLDDRVLPFHDGAFKLAIQAQVPILPLAIDGSHACLPKHTWMFRKASVRVQVLPPIPTTGLTIDDAIALRNRVRNVVMDQLATWRGVTRVEVDSQIPVPTWPEEKHLRERWAEAMASLAELQNKAADVLLAAPVLANEAAASLRHLEQRAEQAMAQFPQLAEERLEELHQKIADAKIAFAEWRQQAGEALSEMPQALSRAIEELAALVAPQQDALSPA